MTGYISQSIFINNS